MKANRKFLKAALIFILSNFFFFTLAFSQVPNSFKYQSMLRKSDGTALSNQSISLRFSILKGSISGSTVYSETQSATTNSLGVINVNIGEGNVVSGSINIIDWSISEYFIKIEMDENGGSNYTLSGVSQLLSVPYALYAKNSGNGFSGNYKDLSNKPTLFDGNYNNLIGSPAFATVATSGSYNDLTNKPKIFSGAYFDLSGKPTLWDSTWSSIKNKPTFFNGQYNSLSGIPSFATVATSGSYNDLSNKPILFSGSYSDLVGKPTLWDSTWASIKNKPTFFNGQYNSLIGTPSLSTVAISGNYKDLVCRPIPWDSSWTSIKNKPVFFSGNYADLSNKPILFTGIYNDLLYKPALWDSTWSSIKNKPTFFNGQYSSLTGTPTFSTVATTGSYSDLSDKPNIDGSETKISAGTNITISGTGAGTSPYVVNETIHTIGESFGGGIVFYVFDGGRHGLIAATADLSNVNWYESNVTTNAIRDGIFAGLYNTQSIGINRSVACAADECATYQGGNFGDWYLPSKYELNLLYLNAKVVGGFSYSYYWSSTEYWYNPNYAWGQNFLNGTQTSGSYKSSAYSVRPIRAF